MDLNRIPKDGRNYHIVWFHNNQWWGDSLMWCDEKGDYVAYTHNDEYEDSGLAGCDIQYYIIGIETFDIINQHRHEV